MKKALVIVDIQYDFLPGGKLPVRNGDRVIPVINAIQEKFGLVVATQDWHPQDHLSFAANHAGRKPGDVIVLKGIEQVLWPQHCIQGSRGAELAAALHTGAIRRVFHKGTDRTIDSYSTFFDNACRRSTGLDDFLRENGVTDVYIAGLATDYCVKYSVLDSLRLGYATAVVADGCKGIDLASGDVDRAFSEMKTAGARILTSPDLQN